MPNIIKRSLLFVLTAAIILAPVVLWVYAERQKTNEPVAVLGKYLKVLYSRDFRQAYRFISSADRELKSQNDYARERGAFDGVALDAARKLSDLIEIRPLEQEMDGPRNRVRVALRLPDANAVGELLLGWDEKRLNALPASEQKKILRTVERLVRSEKVPMIEGEEEFVLVQEGSQWKVFLDWATGVTVKFATKLPANGALQVEPTVKETVARSGDVFTIGFKVKNQSTAEIMTRIAHRIEPMELSEYLDLVECALLFPVRLGPGEQELFNSTYMVRGDLPEGAKTLEVTYAFRIEN